MGAITPKYEVIAADLRAEILNADGGLGPGDVLPSASELGDRYGGATRVTVRRALDLLENDGLIETRQGARARVRTEPLVRIEIDGAAWRRHRISGQPGFDATVAEHGLVPRQKILNVSKDPVAPPHKVTQALRLDDSALTIYRYVQMWSKNSSVRLSHTWFPAAWAAGTRLAERRLIRGAAAGFIEDPAGPIARTIATSVVELEGHRATSEERTLLTLTGESVIHTFTTFYDPDGEPVYVQKEIADQGRHRWRFSVSLL